MSDGIALVHGGMFILVVGHGSTHSNTSSELLKTLDVKDVMIRGGASRKPVWRHREGPDHAADASVRHRL
jgi:hypothetical protein